MVLTEAGAGSDLAALTAYAEQQDDGNWHLYGSKRFITNGAADVGSGTLPIPARDDRVCSTSRCSSPRG